MTCPDPLDGGLLVDYWLGTLAAREEEAVEEHLFSCDDCGARLREIIALAEGVRKLARDGVLRMVVSESFLERAAAEGLRVRQYAPPRGGSVQCTVTAEDDLLIGRLATSISGAKQVDLCICDQNGVEQTRMRDIPVHSRSSEVLWQESITLAKAAASQTMVARLVACGEGGERVLGEYTFHHTRSLPGPGITRIG